ncbi:MAG: energy transducer TonB [Saprospirales bacterium]|jgi:TonB family protein|nr:energy transducer TonB [Saprospirales bacterium]
MQKEKKDKHFIRKPHFEGGLNAMRKIIRENLRYPEEALNNKIEGTVVVKYAIDHLGKVTDAKVIAGIGHGCDEEAIRLVHLFQFQVPKNRGIRVRFHKDIHIHFRLPAKKEKPKPPPAPTAFTYTITPEPADPKPEEKPAAGGYTITLNW